MLEKPTWPGTQELRSCSSEELNSANNLGELRNRSIPDGASEATAVADMAVAAW